MTLKSSHCRQIFSSRRVHQILMNLHSKPVIFVLTCLLPRFIVALCRILNQINLGNKQLNTNMTVLECKFIFYFCSILSLPRKSLQCVLYMTLLLLIPQLIVLAKASSARFDTNNVVNIFGIHFSFFSGLRGPPVLQGETQ